MIQVNIIHEKTNFQINYQTTREFNTTEIINKEVKTLLNAISIKM